MQTDPQQESELEEIEVEAIGIEVSSQPIELYKVFKIANLVHGGGEAKHIISEGYVAVNGEIETRKRRKIYDGDLIEFNQEYYVVLCDLPEGELPEVDLLATTTDSPSASIDQTISRQEQASALSESPDQTSQQQPSQSADEQPARGRKSIQFF